LAGGDLLVQGNEQVDIVALSHPDSGLYSYGDMVLRSANPVGGDAYYWSAGDFRVETLEGTLGDLVSPIDPIIRAFGDVEIENYGGSSLHILAGGSVSMGTAYIFEADPGTVGVDFLQETVTLSDGTVVEIDGGAQPTLDIRAGVNPGAIGVAPLENLTGFNPALDVFLDEDFIPVAPSILATPSSADITVGDVWIDAANGLVLLTNQYEPNAEIPGGSIFVTGEGIFGDGIFVARFDDPGGSVFLDARENIAVTNSYIDATGSGELGDIVLLAQDRVSFSGFNDVGVGAFSGIVSFGEGISGDVRVQATDLDLLDGARLSTSSFGAGNAGNIILAISDTIRLDGVNTATGVTGGILSEMGLFSAGTAGDVRVTANRLAVTNGAQISATNSGSGNAGNILLNIRDTANFDGVAIVDGFSLASGVFSNSNLFEQQGFGGGNVRIEANTLNVINGARLDVSVFGDGAGGSLTLEIGETARFDGVDASGSNASGAYSNFSGDAGRGGDLQITATNLDVTNGAQLDVTGFGTGEAGSILVQVSETARFDGVNPIFPLSFSGAFSNFVGDGGRGGDIRLSARTLEVTNGAQIDGSIFGGGVGGDIVLTVGETARLDGINPFLGALSSGVYSRNIGGEGVGGDIEIAVNNLAVTRGARIDSSSLGDGDGGNIRLQVFDTASIAGVNPLSNAFPSGIFSVVNPNVTGTGGDLSLTATNLELLNGGVLSTANRGFGDAGNIQLSLANQLFARDGTIATTASTGSGGQIAITASDLFLNGDSDIQSFVLSGSGGGGNITLTGDLIIALDDSDILAFSADGVGGNIFLNTPAFFGEDFQPAPQLTTLAELQALEGNDRVDVNATGAIASGNITLPDVSFIENSLTELEDTAIDTASLTAGSCIARDQGTQGTFVVTGRDGLPPRPGDTVLSTYPLGTVQSTAETAVMQEPAGIFQLPDGRLVLSRECR
jgi:large exoprotein involved in heme utilization and adhesion